MKTAQSLKVMRGLIQQARWKRKTIGFVPTMGYLHEGHASLLRQCKKENDLSVLSIFVNPKQFAPNEDFEKYPRDFKKDELLAKKEKVDIIFYPSAEEMYPSGYQTYVEVEELSCVLCGRSRPGHFKGITTVVAKLLNIISPDVMYLGQKDAQQVVILKKVVEDLNFSVKVRIHPTAREPNGLAMSSRNSYLTPKQRNEASILFQALNSAKNKILKGEHDPQKIIQVISDMISQNSSGRIDYIECVNAENLRPLEILSGNILMALAVWFGRARLIDNLTVRIQ